MHEWTELILPFGIGAALGSGLVFAIYKSKLRFYRYVIEQRLAEINHQIISTHAAVRDRANVA